MYCISTFTVLGNDVIDGDWSLLNFNESNFKNNSSDVASREKNLINIGNISAMSDEFLRVVNILDNNGEKVDGKVNIYIEGNFLGLIDKEINERLELNKKYFYQPYLMFIFNDLKVLVCKHYFANNIKKCNYKSFYVNSIQNIVKSLENKNFDNNNYVFNLDDFNYNLEEGALNPNFDKFIADKNAVEIEIKDYFSVFRKNNEFYFSLRKSQRDLVKLDLRYFFKFFYTDYNFTFTVIFAVMLMMSINFKSDDKLARSMMKKLWNSNKDIKKAKMFNLNGRYEYSFYEQPNSKSEFINNFTKGIYDYFFDVEEVKSFKSILGDDKLIKNGIFKIIGKIFEKIYKYWALIFGIVLGVWEFSTHMISNLIKIFSMKGS